jgi:hypothetical protein
MEVKKAPRSLSIAAVLLTSNGVKKSLEKQIVPRGGRLPLIPTRTLLTDRAGAGGAIA